ncbi:MAG: hypothetical protein HY344_00415 [Candidatus Levybacteria bacterium]|nr:hypothetical protein [Candidatus Levybacteria bacterium]
MAKKAAKKTKYESFKLYGKYERAQIAIFTVTDLLIGVVLGYLLQPYIAAAITAYAANSAF